MDELVERIITQGGADDCATRHKGGSDGGGFVLVLVIGEGPLGDDRTAPGALMVHAGNLPKTEVPRVVLRGLQPVPGNPGIDAIAGPGDAHEAVRAIIGIVGMDSECGAQRRAADTREAVKGVVSASDEPAA